MMDFVRTAPDAAGAIIDLVADSQDWPGAAKIAKRFRDRMGLDEDGNPVQQQQQGPSLEDVMAALDMQNKKLTNLNKELDATKKKLDLSTKIVENAEGKGDDTKGR